MATTEGVHISKQRELAKISTFQNREGRAIDRSLSVGIKEGV